MSPRIVAVAPGSLVTGGPEAIHQFVDALVGGGHDAALLYWPPRSDWSVPEPYRHYRTPLVTVDEARHADVVVLPEIMVDLRPHFAASRVWVWWLSVDNYLAHGSATRTSRWVQRHRRARSLQRRVTRLSDVRSADLAGHLTQSSYAKRFLAAHGIESQMLSDYVCVPPPASVSSSRAGAVTNGWKGTMLADRFRRAHPDLPVVAMTRMTREQVGVVLATARVYIDFGHHPGKDRLPREAAVLGCVVFVHEAGAAVGDADVPIESRYKFGSSGRDVARLGRRVRSVLLEPDDHVAAQAPFRARIAVERAVFEAEVAHWVSGASR